MVVFYSWVREGKVFLVVVDVGIYTRVKYLGVLEFEWNLASTKRGSMASRCLRRWGFRIKINCRFYVLLCFLSSFLYIINDTFNLGCRRDLFFYFLLDVWVWFLSLRTFLLINVVVVIKSMYEAAYIFLIPF